MEVNQPEHAKKRLSKKETAPCGDGLGKVDDRRSDDIRAQTSALPRDGFERALAIS
jgi:hypothetical protein